MSKFRTNYGERLKVTLNTGKKSNVQQNMKDECDINKIIEKYKLTGQAPVMYKNPIYDDFSMVEDYQSSLNIIAQAHEQFENLPSSIRSQFSNDPAEFLSFVNDPNNIEAMQEMGLIEKPKKQFDDKGYEIKPVATQEPQAAVESVTPTNNTNTSEGA